MPGRLVGAVCLIAVLSGAGGSVQAATLYVNVNLTTGADNGSSWGDAYRTVDGVARALAAAAANDEIWVAAGTYKPTATVNRAVYINLRSGIAVYGGFAGDETVRDERDVAANITVLSGDLGGNDGSGIVSDNSFHVVNGNSANVSAVLDGFTITAGNANGAMASDQDRGGGLIFLNSSNATIRNCRIAGNRVSFGGGGTYIRSASPTFVDCTWQGNQGASFGGAIDMFTNCSPTFTRCAFIGNSAVRAGGVEVFGTCQPTFTNCVFRGNTAGSAGGGALFVSTSSLVNLRQCTIVANTTSGSGSGVLTTGSSTRLFNCIVSVNTAPGGSTANQLAGATTLVGYSCVQGGFAGTGNINTSPAFVDAGAGDLRLAAGSPCIDAGNNASLPPTVLTDLAGAPRFHDDPGTADTGAADPSRPGLSRVDMGAHEFQGNSCRADWDRSGSVNSSDISAFLTAWLASVTAPDLVADFNDDGVTNSSDISAFLTAWLAAVTGGC